MRVPLYGKALREPIVKEEDSDTGQLADWAGFHSLHTSFLQDINHTGPAPQSLLPLHKDHEAWRGAGKQRLNNMPTQMSGTMLSVNLLLLKKKNAAISQPNYENV